jgi:hypothetical protein
MKKEQYYQMPFDLLTIVGINFGKFANDEKINLLRLLKFGALVNIVLTIAQELIYFADGSNPSVDKLRIVAFASYMFEAFTKFTCATFQEQKITDIINSIENIRHKMTLKQQSILDSSAQPLRDTSQWVGIAYIVCIQLFNILPAIIMLKMYLFGEESVYLHPFPFWYPFIANDYFVSTYIYEMLCGFIAVIAISVIDVVYLMMMSKVIGIFDALVFSIEEIINQNEVGEHDKFNKIIDIHVDTNRVCNSLNRVFGFPILVHVGLASVIMCFTSFVALTQKDIMLIVQFVSVLSASVLHTFLFCWFGTKVDEKVRECC